MEKKTVTLACDHAAFEVKNALADHLKKQGYAVIDNGCNSSAQVDYPDFALKSAKDVAGGRADAGILICGTGIGMSIAANKLRGIRCAHCCDEFSVKATREHNDANMVAFGARILDAAEIIRLSDIFLTTPFSDEERHIRRINKIGAIEG